MGHWISRRALEYPLFLSEKDLKISPMAIGDVPVKEQICIGNSVAEAGHHSP